MANREDIIASLTESLHEAEGRDDGDVYTEAGDLIAGIRDYIEDMDESITGDALSEVAYAWLAGAEHANADTSAWRVAHRALRKARLGLWS